jgi:hypothetical protein
MDSLLLSARDMSDEENVKDAAFELERCHDAESYKRWCERWARALIEQCMEVHSNPISDPLGDEL